MNITFGLCAGRHTIPVEEYIFSTELDPLDYPAMYNRAIEVIPENGHITVYVTGLTAAMLAVVKACVDKHCRLTAMHYDRNTGDYKPQVVLDQDYFG